MGRPHGDRRHTRAAVPDDRLDHRADQGSRHEHPQPVRQLRRLGVDLPGRTPRRLPQLRFRRRTRPVDAGADPHLRLRALDGLRGLPAVTHQGSARRNRRQRPRRRRRPPTQRPHHHLGRSPHRHRLRRLRRRRSPRHQAARRRARNRRPRRCHHCPHAPRARHHEAPRRTKLVGARTTASLPPAIRTARSTIARTRSQLRPASASVTQPRATSPMSRASPWAPAADDTATRYRRTRARRAHHHDRGRQRNRHAFEHQPRNPAASRARLPARRCTQRPARRSRLRHDLRPTLRRLSWVLGTRHRTTPRRHGISPVRRRPLRRCLAGQRRTARCRPLQHRRAVPVALALGSLRWHHHRCRRDRRRPSRCRSPSARRRPPPRPARPAWNPHPVRQLRDAAAGAHLRSDRSRRRSSRHPRRRARRQPASSSPAATSPAKRATKPASPATTPGAATRSPSIPRSTTSASSPPTSAAAERPCSPPVHTPASSTSDSKPDDSARTNPSTSCSAATTSQAPPSRIASTRPYATSKNSSTLESSPLGTAPAGEQPPPSPTHSARPATPRVSSAPATCSERHRSSALETTLRVDRGVVGTAEEALSPPPTPRAEFVPGLTPPRPEAKAESRLRRVGTLRAISRSRRFRLCRWSQRHVGYGEAARQGADAPKSHALFHALGRICSS